MDLNIQNKQIGDVSVVALKGRIVLGEGSSALRERVKNLVTDGKKKIVLNMANVTYIDSAGLGALVAAYISAKKQGSALHLSDLGNKFHEVLQITRLLTVFSVYATEAEAISSFGVSSQGVGAWNQTEIPSISRWPGTERLVIEATNTRYVVHGMRQRWIQSHAHQSALQQDRKWWAAQRQEFERNQQLERMPALQRHWRGT
jgi:anti-sigma B factor antagonist